METESILQSWRLHLFSEAMTYPEFFASDFLASEATNMFIQQRIYEKHRFFP